MLHVDGGVHVDADRQQFLDVLPAFRMARPRRVAVREFVDQHEARVPDEDRIDVEFMQHRTAILDAALRDDLQTFYQRFGVGAPVRFHYADDDVDASRAVLRGLRSASRRFCRRPRRRRRRSSTGPFRHAPRRAGLFPAVGRDRDVARSSVADGARRTFAFGVGTLQFIQRCCIAAAADTRASLRLLDAVVADLVAALTMRAARWCGSSIISRRVDAERRFGSYAA